MRCFVYAKDKVNLSDFKSYVILTDEKWNGRMCMRSSSNVYNQSFVASMIADEGIEAAESWSERIVANMVRQPQGGDTDQIGAIAADECDVAVANHYYLACLIQSDKAEDNAVADAVGKIFPNQDGRGSCANVSGAGVAARAPDRDAAVKFVEHLATPSAQAYFADANSEWPVVADVKLTAMLEEWSDFKTDSVAVSAFGEHNADALKVMDCAGWQ